MPAGFAVANDEGSDYFIPLRNSGRGRRSPVRNRTVVGRLATWSDDQAGAGRDGHPGAHAR